MSQLQMAECTKCLIMMVDSWFSQLEVCKDSANEPS